VKQRLFVIERGSKTLHPYGPPTVEWQIEQVLTLDDFGSDDRFRQTLNGDVDPMYVADVLSRNDTFEVHRRFRLVTVEIPEA
jgi:hypothetical protein